MMDGIKELLSKAGTNNELLLIAEKIMADERIIQNGLIRLFRFDGQLCEGKKAWQSCVFQQKFPH